MSPERFTQILDRRIELIRANLKLKSKEYASDYDRLHNFKRAAELLRELPAESCVGFMTKHIVSVLDLVRNHANGDDISRAQIDEKIGDAINYLILLEAIFLEDDAP